MSSPSRRHRNQNHTTNQPKTWTGCAGLLLLAASTACTPTPDPQVPAPNATPNSAANQAATATTVTALPKPKSVNDLLGRILPPELPDQKPKVYAQGGQDMGQDIMASLANAPVAEGGANLDLTVVFACSGPGKYQLTIAPAPDAPTQTKEVDCAGNQYIAATPITVTAGQIPYLKAVTAGNETVAAYAVIPAGGSGLPDSPSTP